MQNYELELLELEKIILDPENPRLPPSFHNKSEVDTMEYLIESASIIELMNSIGENGFFPGEPIIVVKEGTHFKVVEGNRRVSALKLLHNPSLASRLKKKIKEASDNAQFKPTKVPALIAENVKDVHKFLGFRHITGVKNWNSLEKARYLFYLYQEMAQQYKTMSSAQLHYELAKTIGSRSDYIRRMLIAFEIYQIIDANAFYGIDELDETSFYFVNLSDSLNRANLASFLGVDFSKENPTKNLNEANLREWTHWLYQEMPNGATRVKGKSDQLSLLSDIVVNDKALEAFREGKSLQEASFYLQNIESLFSEAIRNALENIEDAYDVATNIDDYDGSLIKTLKRIIKQCKKIEDILS